MPGFRPSLVLKDSQTCGRLSLANLPGFSPQRRPVRLAAPALSRLGPFPIQKPASRCPSMARHLLTWRQRDSHSRDWPPVRQNWSPSFGFPQIIWLAMRSSKLREWTELEVKTLISMTGRQHSADEISKSLGRYVGSVRTKARQLGLVPVKKPKSAGVGRTDDY